MYTYNNAGLYISQCLSFQCFIFSLNKVLNVYDRHGEHRSDVVAVLPGYELSLLWNFVVYSCMCGSCIAVVYSWAVDKISVHCVTDFVPVLTGTRMEMC